MELENDVEQARNYLRYVLQERCSADVLNEARSNLEAAKARLATPKGKTP